MDDKFPLADSLSDTPRVTCDQTDSLTSMTVYYRERAWPGMQPCCLRIAHDIAKEWYIPPGGEEASNPGIRPSHNLLPRYFAEYPDHAKEIAAIYGIYSGDQHPWLNIYFKLESASPGQHFIEWLRATPEAAEPRIKRHLAMLEDVAATYQKGRARWLARGEKFVRVSLASQLDHEDDEQILARAIDALAESGTGGQMPA